MSEIQLKIEEIPQQHVGKGRAIIDPKIIEETKWNTGQILELTYNKPMLSYGLALLKIMVLEL
jgi:transitional endoplasmic reticulum ATPase